MGLGLLSERTLSGARASTSRTRQCQVQAQPRRALVGSLACVSGLACLNIAARPSIASETDPKTQRIRDDYDKFSATYDELDGGVAAEALGFVDLRRELLSRASGATLETAIGTGLNLPEYPTAGGVTALTGLDVSDGMLSRADARVRSLGPSLGFPVTLVQGDVARMPFQDSSFDTVLDTFSLCVFPDPQSAVMEMARVVRPGGSVLLLEHSRSDIGALGAYQDVTAGAVAATGKGCQWNQDVLRMVRKAGLKIVRERRELLGTIVVVEAKRKP